MKNKNKDTRTDMMLSFLIQRFGFESMEAFTFCYMMDRGADFFLLYQVYNEFMEKDPIEIDTED